MVPSFVLADFIPTRYSLGKSFVIPLWYWWYLHGQLLDNKLVSQDAETGLVKL